MKWNKYSSFLVISIGSGIVAYNSIYEAYHNVFVPFREDQFLGLGIILVASIFYISYNWKGK